LQVVPGRLEALASQLPPQTPRVAESGLESAADAARLAAAGYNLALIGSALMRAPVPGQLLGAMLRAGRAAVGNDAARVRS
jgi:indole-3-glycerol phosphate synthase